MLNLQLNGYLFLNDVYGAGENQLQDDEGHYPILEGFYLLELANNRRTFQVFPQARPH